MHIYTHKYTKHFYSVFNCAFFDIEKKDYKKYCYLGTFLFTNCLHINRAREEIVIQTMQFVIIWIIYGDLVFLALEIKKKRNKKKADVSPSGSDAYSCSSFLEKMAAVDIDVPVETEPPILNQEDLQR